MSSRNLVLHYLSVFQRKILAIFPSLSIVGSHVVSLSITTSTSSVWQSPRTDWKVLQIFVGPLRKVVYHLCRGRKLNPQKMSIIGVDLLSLRAHLKIFTMTLRGVSGRGLSSRALACQKFNCVIVCDVMVGVAKPRKWSSKKCNMLHLKKSWSTFDWWHWEAIRVLSKSKATFSISIFIIQIIYTVFVIYFFLFLSVHTQFV